MRIAIVSDIHGNRTAFEAVLADLKETSPDVVFCGGDLADSGSSPAEIVDRVRDLGWPTVAGNTDEMLFRPESLAGFAGHPITPGTLFGVIDEMAAFTRDALGENRLAWLRQLPRVRIDSGVALVHATGESLWRAPGLDATEAELNVAYGSLGSLSRSMGTFIAHFSGISPGMLVANAGSVSLPYDGDPRAGYLLLSEFERDGCTVEIRRVNYDVARENRALVASGLPHPDWVGRMLETGRFMMPET